MNVYDSIINVRYTSEQNGKHGIILIGEKQRSEQNISSIPTASIVLVDKASTETELMGSS